MMASGISFEERMEARKAEQFARLDKLNNIGVMMILLATLWMMIPKVMASMAGTSALLPELGPALLMLTWAFFIQDLMIWEKLFLKIMKITFVCGVKVD